jgi:signal transduction histidine kinase/ActR/RegA family two-component response regulator
MEDRFRHLLAINRAIAESLDYEELLQLVVQNTVELTRAPECALLLSDESGIARVRAHRGIADEKARAFEAPLDERINVPLRDLLSYSEDDTFLGVPIVQGGQVSGILAVHREGPEPSDPDEEVILSALADQAAIALDHAGRYRQLWEESEAAQRALVEAARRKDEFLAMLSHELRNPLAAISNAHEVLRLAAAGNEKLERVMQIANRQASHMRRLLDDLLDVSRVTRDKIVLDRRPVLLQELIQQAVQATHTLLAARRHELTVELPEEPVVVEADADRILQVVSNLLTNAAKFTPPGGHVRVSLAVEGANAVLGVADDGQGIAPELLPTVFDLFVQAKHGPGTAEAGLGIGLALVRRLAEMHGGSAAATSAGPGRGSQFVVRLPLAPAGETPRRRVRADAVAASGARHVLLVEDNEDVATLMAEALGNLGYQVRVVSDGEAALREHARQPSDVVLIDIGLPGMDGYELARRLRNRAGGRRPLLVAITGFGSPQDRERALQAGFDHHLVKPVQLEQLSRLLVTGDEH